MWWEEIEKDYPIEALKGDIKLYFQYLEAYEKYSLSDMRQIVESFEKEVYQYNKAQPIEMQKANTYQMVSAILQSEASKAYDKLVEDVLGATFFQAKYKKFSDWVRRPWSEGLIVPCLYNYYYYKPEDYYSPNKFLREPTDGYYCNFTVLPFVISMITLGYAYPEESLPYGHKESIRKNKGPMSRIYDFFWGQNREKIDGSCDYSDYIWCNVIPSTYKGPRMTDILNTLFHHIFKEEYKTAKILDIQGPRGNIYFSPVEEYKFLIIRKEFLNNILDVIQKHDNNFSVIDLIKVLFSRYANNTEYIESFYTALDEFKWSSCGDFRARRGGYDTRWKPCVEVEKNQKLCAVCRYWAGDRKTDYFGNAVIYNTSKQEGKCICAKNTIKDIIEFRYSDTCKYFERWPILKQ